MSWRWLLLASLLLVAAPDQPAAPSQGGKPPPARAEKVAAHPQQDTPAAAVSSVPRPPSFLTSPEASHADIEYTKVEISGLITVANKEYGVASQNRLWMLDLGRDRLLWFVVPQLIDKRVLVSGYLKVTDGKLDSVQVIRVEPLEVKDPRHP
jgi:hypothetical protein